MSPPRKEPMRHPTLGYVVCGVPRRQDDHKPGGRRAGEPCLYAAGWGTDHLGIGPCKRHGGNTVPMKRNAARLMADMRAKRELARFGHPISISPAQALLSMVHEAAGNVAYLAARMDEQIENAEAAAAKLEAEHAPADILEQVREIADTTKTVRKTGFWDERTTPLSPGAAALFGPVVGVNTEGTQFQQAEDQRAILRLYGEWTDRLVKYSKAAIDAGVAKAQVELARKQAEMLLAVFKAVMGRLALDAGQVKLANQIVAEEMRKIAASTIEGEAKEVNLLVGPPVKSRAGEMGLGRG